MPAWLPMPPTSRAIPKSRSSISEQSLENLCRYMLRPPLAVERLERLASGRLAYRMKTPWRNGTTHVIMSDGELVEKLAGLVPAPRFQLVRYFGILASAAKQRPSIVPVPPPASHTESCGHRDSSEKEKPHARNYSWSQLMARISPWMCWDVHAAAAGCVFLPLSKIPLSLARFSTVSACPHGHPRLLPLAGTDASKSPNCNGQAGRLRGGVPLTRPMLRPRT